MGIFDRFKKQDKPSEPKAEASSAPEAGLIDFHPYDTGLAESVRALEADLRKLNTNGRRPCGRPPASLAPASPAPTASSPCPSALTARRRWRAKPT